MNILFTRRPGADFDELSRVALRSAELCPGLQIAQSAVGSFSQNRSARQVLSGFVKLCKPLHRMRALTSVHSGDSTIQLSKSTSGAGTGGRARAQGSEPPRLSLPARCALERPNAQRG